MRLNRSFGARGAETRDLLVAGDARRVSWLLMARPLGILWFCGGSVVGVWLALYGSRVPNPGVTLAVIAAAQVMGVGIGLSTRRVPPPWAGHVLMLAAGVAVCVALWSTRGVSSGIELIFLWPAPFAFILVGPRAAVVHVAAVGAAWLVYLAAEAGPRPEAGRWLLSMATLAALSLVSAHLVSSLRGSQGLLHRAFEDAPLAMAFMDTGGRWIASNAALRRMLGRSDDELAGTPVADLLAVESAAAQQLQGSGGAELWVEVTRSAVRDAKGNVACWALQFHDVTARREAEVALRLDADQARWADEVQAAMEGDRVVLYAQPLMPLHADARAGHELLARLVRADGDVVSPGAFMSAVERFGLAPDFDAHVLRLAVGVVAAGRPAHVNVSAHSLGRPEVLDVLRDALAETGADPSLLTLEITETALTNDTAAVAAFGREVADLGCRLALDDFGTGYGTLTYLTSLPVSEIKIDLRFVQQVARDAASAEIVRAVVGLARRLGATTVAEGVEDEATLAVIRELGVDVAQGYLLGRPSAMEGAFLSAAGR